MSRLAHIRVSMTLANLLSLSTANAQTGGPSDYLQSCNNASVDETAWTLSATCPPDGGTPNMTSFIYLSDVLGNNNGTLGVSAFRPHTTNSPNPAIWF